MIPCKLAEEEVPQRAIQVLTQWLSHRPDIATFLGHHDARGTVGVYVSVLGPRNTTTSLIDNGQALRVIRWEIKSDLISVNDPTIRVAHWEHPRHTHGVVVDADMKRRVMLLQIFTKHPE